MTKVEALNETKGKLNESMPLTLSDIHNVANTPELQPKFIWEEILIEKGKCVLYGWPKRGKTNLAIYISLHMAKGMPVLGHNTTKQSVLYLSFEQSSIALSTRVDKMAVELGVSDNFLLHYVRPDKKTNFVDIEDKIKEYKPTVVVIDCLYRLVRTKDDTEIDAWMERFDRLINDYNLSLIVVHHRRKGDSKLPETLDNIVNDASGMGSITSWPNVIIGIVRISARDKSTIEVGFETRDSNAPDNMSLKWDSNTCTYSETTILPEGMKPSLSQIEQYRKDRIIEWIESNRDDKSKYPNITALIKGARDHFEKEYGVGTGWTAMQKYWNIWNEIKVNDFVKDKKFEADRYERNRSDK